MVSGNPRTEYTMAVRVTGIGMVTRRFYDGMVPEDIAVNQCKAYLYALALRKTYDRSETPRDVKMELTRSGIVP